MIARPYTILVAIDAWFDFWLGNKIPLLFVYKLWIELFYSRKLFRVKTFIALVIAYTFVLSIYVKIHFVYKKPQKLTFIFTFQGYGNFMVAA